MKCDKINVSLRKMVVLTGSLVRTPLNDLGNISRSWQHQTFTELYIPVILYPIYHALQMVGFATHKFRSDLSV